MPVARPVSCPLYCFRFSSLNGRQHAFSAVVRRPITYIIIITRPPLPCHPSVQQTFSLLRLAETYVVPSVGCFSTIRTITQYDEDFPKVFVVRAFLGGRYIIGIRCIQTNPPKRRYASGSSSTGVGDVLKMIITLSRSQPPNQLLTRASAALTDCGRLGTKHIISNCLAYKIRRAFWR